MSPDLLLAALKAAFEMGAEAFRFLVTPADQDLVRESLKDKTKFARRVRGWRLDQATGRAG